MKTPHKHCKVSPTSLCDFFPTETGRSTGSPLCFHLQDRVNYHSRMRETRTSATSVCSAFWLPLCCVFLQLVILFWGDKEMQHICRALYTQSVAWRGKKTPMLRLSPQVCKLSANNAPSLLCEAVVGRQGPHPDFRTPC